MAVYWQGTYAITDKLNATLGVRKQYDESDYTIEMHNIPDSICTSPT